MKKFTKFGSDFTIGVAATNSTDSRDVSGVENLVFHKSGFFTDGKGNLIPLASVPTFTVMGIRFSIKEEEVIFSAGNCGTYCSIRHSSWKKKLWAILSLDAAEISAAFKR